VAGYALWATEKTGFDLGKGAAVSHHSWGSNKQCDLTVFNGCEVESGVFLRRLKQVTSVKYCGVRDWGGQQEKGDKREFEEAFCTLQDRRELCSLQVM
jgi:hypothetical protein